jgi:hypothetical protein
MSRKTPRNAQNYRAARRAAWKALKKTDPNGRMPWENYNSPAGYQIGPPPTKYRANIRRNWYGTPIKPKYMPHIGAKQRAKAALKSGAAA